MVDDRSLSERKRQNLEEERERERGKVEQKTERKKECLYRERREVRLFDEGVGVSMSCNNNIIY